MLLFPFEPRRLALLRHACCLATLVLSLGLLGWTSTAWAQSPATAEEAIKKAIQGGQLEQARQLVQKERKNAPQAVQWRFMEGVIQAQQGQIDKAIDTFKQISQTHPDQSEAYNNLGVLYASKGQLDASKVFLEKALQTHPSYAAAHRNLSDVHSQLAKQSYAKALQVDPKAKSTAPQLTLLGSMGNDLRGQPPAQNVASITRPASPTSTPTPGQAASQVPAPVIAATPAAAPATPPAASSSANARQAEHAAIEKAVRNWAKAWSDKEMARYYAAYAHNFTPTNQVTRAQWESDRRIRIVSKKSISVQVRDMKISSNGETASVRFQQLYTSDHLKVSSRKTLDMVRQGNRWLIVRESVN
ncbi:MAG: tetratricopeptide repeat protein [Limnohabitans sp.]|jgi:tetratricopeptide (TPR) repeat protein|uniref:nuclear transport factor 2 family protein n=1 Tax=Limnohabitans sp. TaxID=1907725 RepID=UPI0025F6A37C|nr:tetratricopeptide repeat protein [Limnohabitans sp.]MCO4087961.1 tetratricopeptide repeat protein [Limnohabitans sp.]